MVVLSQVEAKEIEQFKKRRKHFGGDLSVANVHNVPSLFPVMYMHMFHTDNLNNTLLGRPWYSDKDDAIVDLYERAITEGYKIE